jgi:hypothetical protein
MGNTIHPSKLLAAVLLFGLLPAQTAATEPAAPPMQVETISEEAWLGLWQEVTDKPYVRIIFERLETRVELPRESAVYIFTKPSNPAYPGVIRRATMQRGSDTYVEITGGAGGSRQYFEAWAKAYFDKGRQSAWTLAGGGSS